MREETARFPLARRLAEEAERDEVAVLLHFFTFREHLAAFLRAASGAGLGVIVLKGAALAETAYPRPGLRPFGDMDVLVRPSQIGPGPDRVRFPGLRRGRRALGRFRLRAGAPDRTFSGRRSGARSSSSCTPT